MKQKHIDIRIRQCLENAKASTCCGSHGGFGAVLFDHERNVILMDGYNGGPRGMEGPYCGGHFCERDPLTRDMFEIKDGWAHDYMRAGGSRQAQCVRVYLNGAEVHKEIVSRCFPGETNQAFNKAAHRNCEEWISRQIAKHPGVPSGTTWEVGCYHAEMNVILNAAAHGVACKGKWMIVTGEPCTLCAKMIYQVGITKVICIENGWTHADGVEFLEGLGVTVEKVPRPAPLPEAPPETSPAPDTSEASGPPRDR